MLTERTQNLIATARALASTDADMNAAAQSFFDAISEASVGDANAAMRTLGNQFDLEDASRAGFLALVCGSLVERGCDPLTIARPLIERLTALLESSVVLANTCIARLPDADPEDEGEDEDPNALFERAREQVASTMPEQNASWEALGQFWRPAIAVFSVSAESRAAALQLRDPAAEISDYHEAGHWLQLMLSVLDNEPILVIEPQTRIGVSHGSPVLSTTFS